MRHRPTAVTIVLLLAGCASAVFWARSRFYVDEISFQFRGSGRNYYFVSYPGELFFQRQYSVNSPASETTVLRCESWRLGPDGFPVGVAESVNPADDVLTEFSVYWDQLPESDYRILTFKVPYWMVTALPLGISAMRLMRRGRRPLAVGSPVGCAG
jgi:hypothetical protein